MTYTESYGADKPVLLQYYLPTNLLKYLMPENCAFKMVEASVNASNYPHSLRLRHHKDKDFSHRSPQCSERSKKSKRLLIRKKSSYMGHRTTPSPNFYHWILKRSQIAAEWC